MTTVAKFSLPPRGKSPSRTIPHIHRLFVVDDVRALADACTAIDPPAIIGAGSGIDEEGKMVGLPTAWLDQINESQQFDAVLVEADNAASRLFKVPEENEPVVPKSCQRAVWIMAIKALGQPLDDRSVHGAERARELLGAGLGAALSENFVVELVRHPQGCLKGIPQNSSKVALINQADTPEEIQRAKALGEKLLLQGIDRIVVASYASADPVKESFFQ